MEHVSQPLPFHTIIHLSFLCSWFAGYPVAGHLLIDWVYGCDPIQLVASSGLADVFVLLLPR